MAVNTTTAVGTGAGVTSLALGPTALSPGLDWLAQYLQLSPLPSEGALNTAAMLLIFFGGGVIWLVVTMVNWALRKRGIIEESGNASV